MHYLIDTDIVLFHVLKGLEQDHPWDGEGEVWSTYVNMKEAKECFDQKIEDMIEGRPYTLAFSDSSYNWRKELVLPTYKSNRKDTRKPCGFVELMRYAKEMHPSVERPQLEADDVMGIIATNPKWAGRVTIISDDKDLLTIPNTDVIRHDKGKRVTVSVTQEMADYNWMMQTLTGDTVDGYSGCPNIGKVRGEKLLKGLAPSNMWPAVVQQFKKAGLTADDALVQARCARILRHGDYDEETKTVKLWEPSADVS